jgi:hypothetical protein
MCGPWRTSDQRPRTLFTKWPPEALVHCVASYPLILVGQMFPFHDSLMRALLHVLLLYKMRTLCSPGGLRSLYYFSSTMSLDSTTGGFLIAGQPQMTFA